MSRRSAALRVGLGYYVTNGLSAAVGFALIAALVRMGFGAYASAVATIGAIVVIPPDLPAPRRGKFSQLLPALITGLPLFFLVRRFDTDPVALATVLVPATFVAFLWAAWGRRGIPISMSIMFAMIFAMAVPARSEGGAPWITTLYFAMGAGGYVVFAVAANALLNARYRVQMLADSLLGMAAVMRTQAAQFEPTAAHRATDAKAPLAAWLREGAALADRLQYSRDLLLEAPRTKARQRWASMLVGLLEIRDHLLACELDVEAVRGHDTLRPVIMGLQSLMLEQAEQVERLADELLFMRKPTLLEWDRERLLRLPWPSDSNETDRMLARSLASRLGNIGRELASVVSLARGESEPDLAVIIASWRLFVSPTSWSWQTFLQLWHWDAPPLRHAIRAALAVGVAFALSLAMPWATHAYWILLSIVVVLRGSLSQTLERRNARVAGTLLGALLAGAILAARTPARVLVWLVTAAQGVSHAFAVRRYLITSVAATVLALLQARLLNAGLNPTFEAFERIADTLLGVGIAWIFSYVLPAWERSQMPQLIRRSLDAQLRHARLSLGLAQLTAQDNRPEIHWRLARREAYDSLSALVQSTQRALSEPRAVRPPLEPLGKMLAHGYQLLAQLTAVKTMMLVRRGHLNASRLAEPLARTVAELEEILRPGAGAARDAVQPESLAMETTTPLPDPFGEDMTPWLLRRLSLAITLARELRRDAEQATHAVP